MHQDKIILMGEEALDKLMGGIDLLANVVKQTLGPRGRNVIFTDYYGLPRITNDGVTIAKQISSEDEVMQVSIDALKQQAARTNMLAGDASTTFITLSQAIIKEGMNSDKHPLEKRDEILSQCSTVLDALKSTAKPVVTFDEIKEVASVSVESEEIGAVIAQAMEAVGKDGQVNVQESEINGVKVEYTNGLEIDEGYIAEFMMNNERGEAVLENPYILIVDSKLSNIKDILPVMQVLADNGITECLLLCDGADGNMIPTMAKNKHAKVMEGKNVMDVVAVKFPAIRKPEFIEDIALVTQGKIFGMSTGIFPDKAPTTNQRTAQGQPVDPAYLEASKKFIDEYLGRCEKVVVTNKKTVFIGGKGDVNAKIDTLKAQKDASEINKDAFDERIARLQGKVAVIKVGAPAGVDLGYIKDKIEDAVYATKGAIQEGAVRGGGMALKMIALDLPDGILKTALQAPYNQIQENAGGNFVIADNVYDSVKSTRIVVENACSFAGAFLTISSSIATKRVTPEK